MAAAWSCCSVNPFPSSLTPSSPAALGVVVSHQALNRASALASLTESLLNPRTVLLLLLDDRPSSSLSYLSWSAVHLDSVSTIRPKRRRRRETNDECAVVVVVPSTEVLAIVVGRSGDDVLVVGGCHQAATDHCGGTTVGRAVAAGRGGGGRLRWRPGLCGVNGTIALIALIALIACD